ncbi:hypothetical protein B0H10DRAFT_1962378 [Mycena sp. CBHHK59/15]|nr:hypothetical protein B0H10DRAFT_1962378 [Mycena sp. CBHHK59/15]
MGVSAEQYDALKTASAHFLSEDDFSFLQTEAVMVAVFGDDCGSPEAETWKTYWADLGTAEEQRRVGAKYTLPKRAKRKRNGNVHRKEKKDLGHGFDELMASVFIKRKAANSSGLLKPIYYCLGCDSDVRNNTRSHNTSHMLGCKSLQREFPATWKKFKDAINPSAEKVASGEASAGPVQTKKRKIEDPSEGRTPIPGITTPLLSDSDSQSQVPSQRTLDDTCPSYSVPDCSSFITYNLAVEAEHVMQQLQTVLEKFIHLTMSFDGWLSKRNDEISCLNTFAHIISSCRDHFNGSINDRFSSCMLLYNFQRSCPTQPAMSKNAMISSALHFHGS